MCGTMAAFARSQPKNFITEGTPKQGGRLADLMEKGLRKEGVEEDFVISGHPVLDHSGKQGDPILAAGVGLAIMGMDDHPVLSYIIYVDAMERHRLTCREFGTDLPPLTAAAEMLELPFQLLQQVHDLCLYGFGAADAIAELRKIFQLERTILQIVQP